MQNIIEVLRGILSNPMTLQIWLGISVICLGVLIWDLWKNNPFLGLLMKFVWSLTVLYSGLIGLATYFFAGRGQISHDSLSRKSLRSLCHCYSGCGAGEVIGVLVAVGVFALNNWWVIGITFALAYIFGIALTIGPLMQEGASFRQALKDAIESETASIVFMEVVAIGVDLLFAKNAVMTDTIFWTSLIFSLTIGFFAAWPVNYFLVKKGVKSGMMSPKKMKQMAHNH